MKFTEHLSAHITPEWRKQYIQYEVSQPALCWPATNVSYLAANGACYVLTVSYRLFVFRGILIYSWNLHVLCCYTTGGAELLYLCHLLK